ncbi:MAG: TraR/DksA family transcriptional regulator [Planctomycetaceae bacterium]|nr:TraR/DksA family transcriptional regulator [Planctomycetaceae bacterium]
MSDLTDKASDLEQMVRDSAIEGRVRYSGKSEHFCVWCDDEIPERRRQLVPGVKHCVECAAVVESSPAALGKFST